MRQIILASTSLRRKELLTQIIGNNFEIKESSYVEDNDMAMEPKKLVMHHSIEKARDVAKYINSGIVIGSDTLVVYNNQVMGKPRDEDNARQMLVGMNGGVCEVLSGIAVIDVDNQKEILDYELTTVKMKPMTEQEIENYIQSGEPMDKAGAFGIQGKGGAFIEKINGGYSNVVGLPLFKLNNMLDKLGVSIFDYK